MKLRPLVRLTVLFLGLVAVFTGLSFLARGRPGSAAVIAAVGAITASVAGWLLARDVTEG